MKKKLFLLTCLLLAGIKVGAVDWQPVETSVPNVNVYIDMESVKKINNDECLYAIKYSVNDKPEQVAYIKSNSKTNYVGIIQSGDYEIEKYKPNAVFAEPHVFMKPIKEGSFLGAVHNYAIASLQGPTIVQKQDAISTNEYDAVYNKPVLRDDLMVAYNNSGDLYSNAEFRDYVTRTCKILEQNWTPPESGHNTRAILLVSIGADGSLLDYSFAETSGDNITDRSIISAVEKSVPYPGFPKVAKDAYSLKFQFVFEHDLLKKSVVY